MAFVDVIKGSHQPSFTESHDMGDLVKNHRTFGPAKIGSGWPYSVLTLTGAVICFYLAADLYQTLTDYGKAPQQDYFFVFAHTGIGMAFLVAILAFWYFQWSWAHMRIDATGITVRVTCWGDLPETHLSWATLETITLIIIPRGASLLRFTTQDKAVTSISVYAFAKDPDDYLEVFEGYAQSAGYALGGAKLKSPVIGQRVWTVIAKHG